MSNAIARFRARQNMPRTVEVPWPLPNPEITFKVAPFSTSERMGATWAAEKILVSRGIVKPAEDDMAAKEAYQQELNGHFFAELADVVKRHIKGWEHKPTDGEPLNFSPAILEQLFSEMTLVEKMALGLSYTAALLGLEKKKEDGADTPKDSSKD